MFGMSVNFLLAHTVLGSPKILCSYIYNVIGAILLNHFMPRRVLDT